MNQDKIIEKYKQIISDATEELSKYKAKSRLFSFLRLIAFILGLAGVYILFDSLGLLLFYLGFTITLFLLLVKQSIKIKNKIEYLELSIKINNNEIAAINNNQQFFYNGEKYLDKNHNYSFDLDIFGNKSIFQLINRTTTPESEKLLSQLFTNQNLNAAEIHNRQKLLKELASKFDFRQEFILQSLLNNNKNNKIYDVFKWLDKKNKKINSKIVRLLLVFFVTINIATLFLSIFKVVNYNLFFLSFIATLFYESFFIKEILKSHSSLSNVIKLFRNLSILSKHIENEKFETHELTKKQKILFVNKQTASKILNKFLVLNNYLDSSKNILLGVILNGIFLWDLYFIIALEKNKLKYSKQIKSWTDLIIEFDTFISLSTFVYNFPDNNFPIIKNDDNFILEAKKIAHPLIDKTKRIANDFKIDNYGKIVIITGANMAGKSTFLRTVGVNIVLAKMGLNVCAKEFVFSNINLFTSMRTSDDLANDTSYFQAELLRLQKLNIMLDNGEKVFIILDEILKGTNSVDKERGSKAFLEKIKEHQLAGIVATHDLSLGELEKKYPHNFQNKSFEVEFVNNQIKFDYILRDGITQKMNAYFLMQKMGLI